MLLWNHYLIKFKDINILRELFTIDTILWCCNFGLNKKFGYEKN